MAYARYLMYSWPAIVVDIVAVFCVLNVIVIDAKKRDTIVFL